MKKPLHFKTLNGQTKIFTEIITELPIEFNEKNLMSWKITKLLNKPFEAIIGQNILEPMGAIINLSDKYIEIHDTKIKFIDSCPYEFEEIYEIEKSPPKEDITKKLIHNEMNEEEIRELKKLVLDNLELFFKEGDRLTHTHEIQHEIITTLNKPVYAKMYRYPQIHETEIKRQINEMLEQGVIKESNSPYNSPLWIVPKKIDNSGKRKWRIVIDYRKLNEITENDKFPMPNIESILEKIGRAQYFTTLDLAKGFHQVLIKKEDRRKTAFSTPLGHYEFVRMPFGLKNAPATFQRLINSVLREYINKICVVYLDDILIFSTNIQEHKENIQKIFNKLKEHNLKIQIDKCKFFAKTTEFLGHTLTKEGIKPNMTKIENIQKLKIPETQRQIKSFLGITGYYRKFIKDYAKVAHGMTKYLKKGTKINKNDPQYVYAFEKLKQLLINPPVLRYVDFTKKFSIATDASDFAIGAVLTQDEHPISYASRTLNEHERKYSTTERELLAIVWAVNYFRPYIYGRTFDLVTDHQPLIWLQSKQNGKDINPRLQRWILKLGEYNINMKYIKGKENNVADFLSRINTSTYEINTLEEQNELDNISTCATIHSQEEELNDHFPILETAVNRFHTQIILTKEKTKEIDIVNNKRKIYISLYDIESNFMTDIFRRYLHSGKIGIYSDLTEHQYHLVQLKLIELFSTQLKFYKCVYHAKDMINEEETLRYIAKFHKNETGHAGINENYANMKKIIYFRNLKKLIQKYINNCDVCNRAKYDRNPIKQKFQLTETPNDINQIVHIDTYTNTKHHFLTFIDRFSKHAVTLPLTDRNNITIIENIRLYLSIKGEKPQLLILDNEFNTINIKDFLRQEEINVHFTKPNSHTGNSDIERFHSSIGEKIRILEAQNSQISTTDKILKSTEWYNKSIHSATNARPIDIIEGRVDKQKLYKKLTTDKQNRLTKLNERRELYEYNTQSEGYVKNYKALRHKNEPKYRKIRLENIHPSNIKRSKKFADTLDTDNYSDDYLAPD